MKYILIFVALTLLVSPVLASNVTVTGSSLASAYLNTRSSSAVLNLTLRITENDAVSNVTIVNVTLVGGEVGNISAVEIRSATDSALGSNTTNSTPSKFTVYITNGHFFNESTNSSIKIIFNISSAAARFANLSANISSVLDVGTANTDNITITGGTTQSQGAQIQDMHANSSVSPRFVDTSVINQSFMYSVIPTGTDKITALLLQIPTSFTNINLTSITIDGSNSTAHTNTTIGNLINVTPNTPTLNRIDVYFTANTSATSVVNVLFNSSLYGANLTNITTDAVFGNQTNVTTQPILNMSNIRIVKSTAIVNGTDYWEFNFTLNYTATISTGGLIQFKMTNWTNSDGRNISLTNVSADSSGLACAALHCATMRNESNFNTTGRFNVTNGYESLTKGISVSSITQNGLFTVVLRMVIPSGTPISSSWQSTYVFLFRAYP